MFSDDNDFYYPSWLKICDDQKLEQIEVLRTEAGHPTSLSDLYPPSYRRKIGQLLRKLTKKQREVVELRLRNYSFYEISQELDIKENVAKNRYFQAIKRLKRLTMSLKT